jgi:intein/homing endonuclease
MKIKEIKSIGRQKVYDLSVKDTEHYILKNGVVTHNTGIMYSADNVWIIGRQQDKDGTEIQGYHFVINVEKSRFVKEKSKITISVSWEGGVQKWSGLLDVAIDGGYVVKPKNGWYQAWDSAKNVELTGNLRAAQTMTKEFWETVFKNTDFAAYLKNKYTIGLRDMMNDVEVNLDRIPESTITFEESAESAETDD